MANRTVYVDGTDSGTHGQNGAHYPSLQQCITDEVAAAPNLSGDSCILTIECSVFSGDAADTTACTVNGFTTSSTYYVWIKAATTSHATAAWTATKYRLEVPNATALLVQDNHVRIEGLQIATTSASANNQHIIAANTLAAGSWLKIYDCILKGHNHATYYQHGLDLYDTDATFDLRNVVLYNVMSNVAYSNSYGIYINSAAGSIVSNVTVHGGTRAIADAVGSTVTATNCVVRNSYAGFYGTFATASDYNSSSVSGNAPNTGGSGNNNANSPWYSGATTDANIFENVAGEDFHLKAAGTIFTNVGTDLSGTFTTDIDGETRPTGAGTWDLGADEYVSTAGPNDLSVRVSEPQLGGSTF